MEIVKIPIVDFIKYSLDAAYQSGFTWAMCLLAREADAEKTYDQIKRHWDSFHDITGNTVLFVFSGGQDAEEKPNQLLWHEAKDYRALFNPAIRFVNNEIPTVPDRLYPAFYYDSYQINRIAVTHSRSITELRQHFGLSEKDVPSLVFIPTDPFLRNDKVVVRLNDDNLYQIIKNIIETLESPLNKLKKAQESYAYIETRLKVMNNEVKALQIGTSTQNRFVKAKNYLDDLIRTSNNNSLKEKIQYAIKHKSKQNWHDFDHQTRAHLNRYLDLIEMQPNLESEILSNSSRRDTLNNEILELRAVETEIKNRIKDINGELTRVIQGIMSVNREEINVQNSKRFKVALSFPGEHRDLVESIAEKLAMIFGKQQILYDKYHRAEFARQNLDVHLQKLYHNHSDMIVVFICADYQKKRWCGIEWRAIRDLMNQGDADERIMFIRCGSGSVDGFFGTIDGLC